MPQKIKVKGEKLAITEEPGAAEVLITGATTGDTGGVYSNVKPIKIKGTYLHWVDMAGNWRRKQGVLTGATGGVYSNVKPIKIKGDKVYYIDQSGDERSLSSTIGYVISSSGWRPRIRRASDGRLWVVYSISYTIYARYSDDDGVTWSAAETIHTTGNVTGDGPEVDLVLDSSDVPHVIWAERIGGSWQKRLYYTYRDDENWGVAAEDITGADGYYKYPRIAIDSSNYIHIIYHDGSLGSAYARYIKGSSGSWGAEYRVDAHTYHDLDSQDIAIDSNNYVHVAYTSRRSRSVYYRLYTDSWQAEETLYTQDDYTITQCRPRIAIDSSNNIHYVWTGRGFGVNTGYHNIQYMKRTSGSWGSQVGLTDLANHQATLSRVYGYGYGLDIAITTANVIHIVWQWQIKHISYDGSWSAIDEPTDESTTVHQLLCHRHPSNQGILASGYYLVCVITELRFYEGV